MIASQTSVRPLSRVFWRVLFSLEAMLPRRAAEPLLHDVCLALRYRARVIAAPFAPTARIQRAAAQARVFHGDHVGKR